MKKLTKNTFLNLTINKMTQFKRKNDLSATTVKRAFRTVALLGLFFIVGCGPRDTGDLVGAQGRRVWFHPQPYGMLYIPSGTFHTGQSDQDIFNSYLAPNKQVTISSFWMDETEISNNEYRQFVEYVIDSIARYILGEDPYLMEDEDGEQYINYRTRIRWDDQNVSAELEEMYYRPSERFRRKKEFDTRKLFFEYQWIDYHEAAHDDLDRYNPKDRSKYIKKEKTLIYPDTLCFIRDFTYSYNEPMARHYFHHPKYDDYPVVGINWHMANAFCYWRARIKDDYWTAIGAPPTEMFRLPSEFEWEYAARGGKNNVKYPWGDPYTRNSKGCMLANFKPLRGNYGADGGVYPVRIDSYFPNDYGLYNMAGNVSEWTRNTFEISTHVFSHDLNPDYRTSIPEFVNEGGKFTREMTPVSLKRKVIRGGSWKDIAYFIENGSRTFEYQDSCRSFVGFRCVQEFIGRSNKDRK